MSSTEILRIRSRIRIVKLVNLKLFGLYLMILLTLSQI